MAKIKVTTENGSVYIVDNRAKEWTRCERTEHSGVISQECGKFQFTPLIELDKNR